MSIPAYQPATTAKAQASPRTHAHPRTQPRTQATTGHRLRVVANPVRDRSLLPFVVVCALILCAAMGLSLLLHTQMANSAYDAFEMETELAILQEENALLQVDLLKVSAPQVVTSKAEALGMVPASERIDIVLNPAAEVAAP